MNFTEKLSVVIAVAMVFMLAFMLSYTSTISNNTSNNGVEIRTLELKLYELQDRVVVLESLKDVTVTIDVVDHTGPYHGVVGKVR